MSQPGPHPDTLRFPEAFRAPGDGTVSTAVDGASGPLCLMMLQDAVDLPVAATNGYTEDNGGNVSCEPALGRECVAALLNYMDLQLGGSGNVSDHRDGGRREWLSGQAFYSNSSRVKEQRYPFWLIIPLVVSGSPSALSSSSS
ncbi:hypothetical protein DL769_005658 [Monosporascus sp. CRB-8-3]|nr:hypothetical protein DL769_005658 [Monosporascus sp. CRB-8-3]